MQTFLWLDLSEDVQAKIRNMPVLEDSGVARFLELWVINHNSSSSRNCELNNSQ